MGRRQKPVAFFVFPKGGAVMSYPRFVLIVVLIGAVIFAIQKLLGKNDRPWF